MNVKRITLALIIALVISGLFTFWLSRKVGAHPTAVVVKQRYAAAARPLEAGEALKADSLQMIEWPVSVPLQGGFAKAGDLVGRVVLYPLAQGEPIVTRQLAVAGSGAGLTGKIPLGMRALSLRSDDVVGVAGFLLPGTHVDVLVTYRTDKVPEPATATVVQDVVVLAAGHQIDPDPEGKAASVDVVTLMVKPEDGGRVVLASTQGTIHFVLRNGGDRSQTDSKPIMLSQLMGGAATQAAPVHHAAPAAGKAAVPRPYAVETMLGTKQTVSSF